MLPSKVKTCRISLPRKTTQWGLTLNGRMVLLRSDFWSVGPPPNLPLSSLPSATGRTPPTLLY